MAVEPEASQTTADSTRIIGPAFSSVAFTSSLVQEMLPPLPKHKDEVSHYPDVELKPCFDKYQKVAEGGWLRIFVARHGRDLIGYQVFIVHPHLHYADLMTANLDLLYLDPSMRGKFIGLRFIKWAEQQLREELVPQFKQVVITHHLKAKKELNYSAMLEREGYTLMDLIFVKRLDQ